MARACYSLEQPITCPTAFVSLSFDHRGDISQLSVRQTGGNTAIISPLCGGVVLVWVGPGPAVGSGQVTVGGGRGPGAVAGGPL